MRYRYRITSIFEGIVFSSNPPRILNAVFPNKDWGCVEVNGDCCDVYFNEKQSPILINDMFSVEEKDISIVEETVLPEQTQADVINPDETVT
jgi:hypothetical protein